MKRIPYNAYDPTVVKQVSSQVPTPDTIINRGNDNKAPDDMGEPISVPLQLVDSTVISYLSNRIKPQVYQDGNVIVVPVVYGSPEKWKAVQVDGAMRDKFGKVQLPLIMIRRTGMRRAGMHSPVNKYLASTFKTKWNRRNPYDKFQVQNGITPSEEFYTAIRPDYYNFTYELQIWTEFVEQLNHVVEQISFEFDEFWGDRGGFRFRVTSSGFNIQTLTPINDDRIVKATTELTAFGYVLPETALDKNGQPTMLNKVHYSPKKVVTFVEVVDTLK